jgi:hypothetical protein
VSETGRDGQEVDAQKRQRRKVPLGRTLLAVLWSFFGVRKAKDLERDVTELNPLHVVIAGVVVAALFVGMLFMLVQWVIRSGVAA